MNLRATLGRTLRYYESNTCSKQTPVHFWLYQSKSARELNIHCKQTDQVQTFHKVLRMGRQDMVNGNDEIHGLSPLPHPSKTSMPVSMPVIPRDARSHINSSTIQISSAADTSFHAALPMFQLGILIRFGFGTLLEEIDFLSCSWSLQ